MILSKNNLLVHLATGKDKDVPVLDNIRIENDGSTVGASATGIVVCSPVSDDRRRQVRMVLGESDSSAVTVSSGTVKSLVRNMPKDTMFDGALEHVDVKADGNGSVLFKTSDGVRTMDVEGKTYTREYIPYKKVLRSQLSATVTSKVIVDGVKLRAMLEAVNKITDGGELYLSFTDENDVIIRGQNLREGQRVVGTMKSYEGKGAVWLEGDAWERGLSTQKQARRKKK